MQYYLQFLFFGTEDNLPLDAMTRRASNVSPYFFGWQINYLWLFVCDFEKNLADGILLGSDGLCRGNISNSHHVRENRYWIIKVEIKNHVVFGSVKCGHCSGRQSMDHIVTAVRRAVVYLCGEFERSVSMATVVDMILGCIECDEINTQFPPLFMIGAQHFNYIQS